MNSCNKIESTGKIFFLGALLCVYFFAGFIQAHLVLNGDVSTLMHETQKLLAGGSYTKDFFEPKPPMIFYLYALPVIFSDIFSISFTVTLPIYVFLLSALSLAICYPFIRRLVPEKMPDLVWVMLFVSAIVFVVLPLSELGQGENLLIILTMPYLFASTARLDKKHVSRGLLSLVGIMAGIGFAIKPHYLATFVLVEVGLMIKQRNWFAWLRCEALFVVGVILVYLLSIFVFHRDYIFFIVPMVSRFYYPTLGAPWSKVLLNPGLVYCLGTLLFYGVVSRENPQKNLSMILVLAVVGYAIAFIVQDTPWYYHIYPALAIAILANAVFVTIYALQGKANQQSYLFATALAFLMFAFLFYFVKSIWVILIFSPLTFFGFFFLIFSMLFLLAKPNGNPVRIVSTTLFIMAISFAFTYFASRTPWFQHRFLLTIFLLFLFFGLCVSTLRVQRMHLVFVAVLSMLVFAFPWYNALASMAYFDQYKVRHQGLIDFLNKEAAHHSVYFFSSVIDQYPILDYVNHVSYASRYPCLVWLPSLFNNPNPLEKKYYIDSVAEELNQNKPDYVLVDIKKNKIRLEHIEVDYVSYFSENPQFKAAWQAYYYLKTLEGYPTYQFAVYARKKNFS